MAIQDVENASNVSEKSSLLLRLCCAITFTDITVLHESNSRDAEKNIILRAFVSITSLLITIPTWTLLLMSMLQFPIWGAIYGGCFVGMVIYLLDTAITRADWELKGILAKPGFVAVFARLCRALLKTCLRLPLALNFSILTGVFVTMSLFHDSLENQIEQNRQQHNAPIERKYQAAQEKLYADLIGTAQNNHHALTQERQQLLERINQFHQDQQIREDALSQARYDKQKEILTGDGPNHKNAVLREKEALRHIELLEQNIAQDNARLKELDRQSSEANTQIQAAQTRFTEEKERLIAERDMKLLPVRSDVLMWIRALHQLMEDDEYGKTVTYTTYAIELFFITIEMMIFINAFFESPSPYTVALRERTRTQARQVELNYELTRDNQENKFMYHKKLLDRQLELQYNHELRNLEASSFGAVISPANVQLSVAANTNTTDKRLFEIPAEEMTITGTDQVPCHAQFDEQHKDKRYPVIGSEKEEQISTTEALADPKRYWVNPNNPTEIWLHAFRKQLFD